MKFKCDENLPEDAALLFCKAGLDCSTVVNQDLSGTQDDILYTKVKQEDRVLITLDLHFSDIRAYPPADHPGMIILRLKSQDIPSILSVVKRLLEVLATETIEHRLLIVDDKRIRIRE